MAQMKIAVITSGLLPLPATNGGAIEVLLDNLVEQNETQGKFLFDVYSISDSKARLKALQAGYEYTRYIYTPKMLRTVTKIFNKITGQQRSITSATHACMIKKINNAKYDYILIENYPELSLDVHCEGARIVVYVHSDVLNTHTNKAKDIMNKVDCVVAVSNFIASRVRSIGNKNKVRVVANSIDLPLIDTASYKEIRAESRKKYGIKNDDFVFAYSGRISKEKGVYELAKAFSEVHEPRAKLLIVGGIWYGTSKKDDYIRKIESLNDERIIFTGYVKHSEVFDTLCAADCGVAPSICNEAAGLSVVEFMRARCVVVVSNRGGLLEYVNTSEPLNKIAEDGNAFIANLSKCVRELMDAAPDSVQSTKEANFQFSKQFTPEKNYVNFAKVLEDVA